MPWPPAGDTSLFSMTPPAPRRRRPRRPTPLMVLGAGAVLAVLCCGVPGALWSHDPGPVALPDQDPAVEAVLSQARSRFPEPGQTVPEYLQHARARVDRGVDLEGAADAAMKALVLEPENPHAAGLLIEASGASGGEFGVSLAQAQSLLEAVETQGALEPDLLLLARGHLAMGQGELLTVRSALEGLQQESWGSRRLTLELALLEGRLDDAQPLAEAFVAEQPEDASLCRVDLHRAIAAGQLLAAESSVNACLAAGAQDPRLSARLALLADQTGRPAIAASRYAAAGLRVQALAVQWQEGILSLAQARAQLRGQGVGERTQRTWMALSEGDTAAAMVESEGLEGAPRAAALLRSGATTDAVLGALTHTDPTSEVIAALATRGGPEELGHWQAALAPWPGNPDVLRAWRFLGGEGTQEALQAQLAALPPSVLLGARAVPVRSAPLGVLVGEVDPAICRDDPCRVLARDLSSLQGPVFKALVATHLGELNQAKGILAGVPGAQRDAGWALAMAGLDLASEQPTAAQATVVPMLQTPGAKCILAQAVAQRGSTQTALETLGALLQEQAGDQIVWELTWKISSSQAQADLDSTPPAQ